MSIYFILFLICSFIATYLITKKALDYANKAGLIDHPGFRTSHGVSTPRGGGVAIIIVFYLGLIFFKEEFFDLGNGLFLSLLSGGLLVSVIGFWDDHRYVPTKIRLLIHFCSAFISLYFIPHFPSIHFFSVTIDFSILTYLFYSLILVWMLNLYNFMDGIDGVASVEAITVLLGATFIFLINGNTEIPQIFLLLSVCVAGFLILNWSPAKIFMGDAGSGFLGFTIGLFAIISSSSDFINIWSWLILLGVFVVDATFTLFRKILCGGKWHEAHRSHSYQIISRYYNSHQKITVGILILNVIWLFPIAFLASIYQFYAPILTIIALAPLLFIAYKVGAGWKNE